MCKGIDILLDWLIAAGVSGGRPADTVHPAVRLHRCSAKGDSMIAECEPLAWMQML